MSLMLAWETGPACVLGPSQFSGLLPHSFLYCSAFSPEFIIRAFSVTSEVTTEDEN